MFEPYSLCIKKILNAACHSCVIAETLLLMVNTLIPLLSDAPADSVLLSELTYTYKGCQHAQLYDCHAANVKHHVHILEKNVKPCMHGIRKI